MQVEKRDFFKQISTLAFVNPFSKEREQADCQLLQIQTGTLDLVDRVEKIQLLLSEQLTNQGLLSGFNINQYQGTTREIMKFSWMFYQFHVFQLEFNQFIDDQGKSAGNQIELPFAASIIETFQQAGFTDSETEKYIGLFYQLHRGFYFINSSITGSCPSVVKLRVQLWNNIFTFNPHWYLDHLCGRMEDFSTLLLGETGTGKSLAAHAIGCSGFIPFEINKKRFKESFTDSFQAINLSQYSSSLIESELFGHKKGAFTGAIDHHQGLFSRCSVYGAVFIDEIGDIDIPTQVKLLNVVQDRLFSPVGSHEKCRFSGRVISATNRNIQQLLDDKAFRTDLYYRLCSDVIEVPSLQLRIQENPNELSQLIAEILKRVIDQPDLNFVAKIEARIAQSVPSHYNWPGNVRELEQCVRRICLTGQYQVTEKNNKSSQKGGFTLDIDNSAISAQQLMQDYCRYLYDIHQSYEAVARVTQLDRRTVKKYIVD